MRAAACMNFRLYCLVFLNQPSQNGHVPNKSLKEMQAKDINVSASDEEYGTPETLPNPNCGLFEITLWSKK